MKIKFYKMHSFHNDFIIIDNNKIENNMFLTKSNILKIANRKTGVGFDQLFIIKNIKKNEIECNIYNSDSSESDTCCNGLRCLGLYINKFYNKKKFTSVVNKIKTVIFLKKKTVNLFINVLDFRFKTIGFKFCLRKMFIFIFSENININFFLRKNCYFSILYIGNPHAIFFKKTKIIEVNSVFKKYDIFILGINISYYYNLILKTFERGVGFTESCGSATVSTAIVIFLQSQCKKFLYKKKGEKMTIISKKNKHFSIKKVLLKGSGSFIFSGKIKLNDK